MRPRTVLLLAAVPLTGTAAAVALKAGYTEHTVRALAHYTDPVTATAAAATMNGLTLRGLAATTAPDRAGIEAVLLRVLTTPNPTLPQTTAGMPSP
ncbi:hypothetical protein ACWDYJ_32665 [Streptomyces sp. NPDC003042]